MGSFVLLYSGPIIVVGTAAMLWWRHPSITAWILNAVLGAFVTPKDGDDRPLLGSDDGSIDLNDSKSSILPTVNEIKGSKATSHKSNDQSAASSTRCSACRRVVNNSHATIFFNQLILHQACLTCRDCGCELLDCLADASIDTFWSNGKLRFTCAPCRINQASGLHDSYASIAGERVVVSQSEHGDVDGVLGEIGDDLEQAVYFMTPRCATCGGDLNQTYGSAEGIRVIGRTVYHNHCFVTGVPPKHLPPPTVKLPPSFCAKYLSQQIILKLTCHGKTLTTLYFCWPDRVKTAEHLRENDDEVVIVSFVLDASAPANPNYQRIQKTEKKNFKSPAKHIAVPACIQDLTIELVPGDQVPPRNPWMAEYAYISHDANSKAKMIASLYYLHFGLEYCLTLSIPIEGDAVLSVVDASLSVRIRDWQSPGRQTPHITRRNTDPI
jgi:hypothetical protein